MYDPDPQRPALRLGEPKAIQITEPSERLSTAELLMIAEAQMEAAIKAWVSATIDYAAERRQSQPISAARPVGDGRMRYERPMVFRQNGSSEALDGFQPLDAPL